MMRHRFRHAHPCQSCGAKTPCDGELAENYDGEPPIICLAFHLKSGELNPDFFCEACACVDCGARATTTAKRYTWHDRYELEKVCDECAAKRENYEPPDPDGEAFRGGEAAAYWRDQVEAARRLK